MRVTFNRIVEGVCSSFAVVSPEHAQNMLSKQVVKLRWEWAEKYFHWRYRGEITW
ncbi:unnamed protein product [marine sediment metagenome]|uniref:Uncharacterized protein n=1 Tax=marine sediment metagenome TaxID=412755 RepID=X1P7I8_9ZZZZ